MSTSKGSGKLRPLGYYGIRAIQRLANWWNKGVKLPFKLDNEAIQAFQNLVEAMSMSPVLALSVVEFRFSIHTDASTSQIGAVFFLKNENGEHCPVAYRPRQLNPEECNYPATENECFALV